MDPTDEQIIALLQENARRSFADIGERVGLSAAAVKRRVDRLEARGIIRGYTAIVDHAALGLGMDVFVELFCTDRTAPIDVLATIHAHPDVVAAYTVTGEADALVHLRVASIKHLEAAIERLRRDKTVARTKTLIVMSSSEPDSVS